MQIIRKDDEILAIVKRKNDWEKDLDFLSDEEDFIQVGTWNYNCGKILQRHYHNKITRSANLTQECVIIMSGKLQVSIYDKQQNLHDRLELSEGDFAIFLQGGHGYEVIENETKVIEVKNGPFLGVELDKTRF